MLRNRDFGNLRDYYPNRSERFSRDFEQENEFNTIDSQSAHASVGGDVNNVIVIENAVVGVIVNVQVGNAALNVAANVAVDNDLDQNNKVEEEFGIEL